MFAKTFYFFKIFLLSIYLSHISELFAFTQSNKNENFVEKSYKRPNYEYSKIGFPFSLKVKNIRNDHCVEAAEHDDYLTFDQQLDHFDSSNNATWKQRYLANMAFFDFSLPSYSPMFLMFGEKREIRSLFVSAGQMFNNAKQFNAGMVILEHRYFGESHPTANTSIENLKYFTIEQSLEDAVTFIKFIKRKYNISDNHKWIIFGGDYAGNLAAWLRLKHPDLVLGAVASSAPLQAKLSFDTFLQEMDTDLGKGCVNEVRLAMNEFTHKLGSDSGREYLTNLFGLCTPLKNANQLDISLLVYIISIPFQGAAMFNEENPRFPNEPGVCEIMTDRRYGASALERLRVTLWEYRISNCVYFQYKPYVDLVAEVGWLNYTSDYRMRLYLQCSSIGQFVTTSHNVDQPFGDYFSVEFFVQQCKDIFGPQFDQQAIERAVERTNKVYGGANLSTTPTLSNVVYVNGQRDPWRVLGVLEQPPNRPTLLPVVISGSAHNEDIDVPDVHDSPELTEARAKINKAIERMLAEQQQQQQQQH